MDAEILQAIITIHWQMAFQIGISSRWKPEVAGVLAASSPEHKTPIDADGGERPALLSTETSNGMDETTQKGSGI